MVFKLHDAALYLMEREKETLIGCLLYMTQRELNLQPFGVCNDAPTN